MNKINSIYLLIPLLLSCTENIELFSNSDNIIEDAYYKTYRIGDDYDVIRYGTGSVNHTRLSYDVSGNYFDLDMSLLESDNVYAIKFVYYLNSQYVEQSEIFKFRVE